MQKGQSGENIFTGICQKDSTETLLYGQHGIFVGCIAVALAEILNTFPIIFRRFQIKEGLSWIMLFMAFGKCAGAFWYFGHHMTPP